MNNYSQQTSSSIRDYESATAFMRTINLYNDDMAPFPGVDQVKARLVLALVDRFVPFSTASEWASTFLTLARKGDLKNVQEQQYALYYVLAKYAQNGSVYYFLGGGRWTMNKNSAFKYSLYPLGDAKALRADVVDIFVPINGDEQINEDVEDGYDEDEYDEGD